MEGTELMHTYVFVRICFTCSTNLLVPSVVDISGSDPVGYQNMAATEQVGELHTFVYIMHYAV